MSSYLTLFQYTPQAVAALKANPQDRSQAVSQLMQDVGGQMLNFYWCFGEYDGLFLWEAPDDISAQAAIVAFTAAGHVSHERTITLHPVDEKMQVLEKATSLSYAPPLT